MKKFEEKLYHYSADPPAEIWDHIHAILDESEKKPAMTPGRIKRSKLLFYGMTAAASLIIIVVSSLLFNKGGEKQEEGARPILNTSSTQAITSRQIQDSIDLNNKILNDIINASKDKNLLARNYENSLIESKKYITIEGPAGQPVKISPKVATLIESTDDKFPPKPVWNKKIEKWKEIMLSTTLSPTSINLVDLAEGSSFDSNNK